jgi:ankyrin repeat protein
VRILELLIKKGINVNEGDYDKRTPLHVASAGNQIEAVKLLLEHGADINPFDRWGSTPLNDADNKDIEALLLSKGAKRGKKQVYQPIKLQNLRDDDNRLFYAAFKNDLKNMAILKNSGWQVNAFDYDGRTALGIAASEGNIESVQFLVENGANIRHRDARGNNAFDDAIRENRQTTIDFLKGLMA